MIYERPREICKNCGHALFFHQTMDLFPQRSFACEALIDNPDNSDSFVFCGCTNFQKNTSSSLDRSRT